MRTFFLITLCVLLVSCSKESKLLDAAAKGDLSAVRELVSSGADVNHWDDGRMALSEAAKNGHSDVVAFLLENGASPVYKHKGGRTALHEGAEYGHSEIVSLLIKHKAEINLKSDYGSTPLSLAEKKGHDNVVKILRDAGAKDKSQLRKKREKLTKEEALKRAEESRQRYLESRKRYNE